jgi:hypothetical protein
MKDFDEIQLAQLARELTMNVRNYKHVFADYGIDESDYYEIEKNPYYKKVKEHFTIEWNSALSSAERLRLVSFAYLERLAPVLTKRALQEETALAASTDFSKVLMKMAGIGEERNEKSAGERFVISIRLGGDDVETYDKSIEIKADTTNLLPQQNEGKNG